MKILNIQRMSTEDGPGLRTTLFVKGCTLSCKWCHNPESIDPKSHVEWIGVRCIGCRTCIASCPRHGITLDEDGAHTSSDCDACGTCVKVCPTEAREMKGIEKSPEELFYELIKDKAYWGDEGGVTLSGGEILMQADDAAKLLKLLHDAGIHTAVDTCGFVSRKAIEKVMPYTDIFLFDLKLFDADEHKRFTNQSNEVILENFEFLVNTGKRIWVRTPIIPGATDTDGNIKGIASVVRNRVEKWELCAFNNLCGDKYERLGKEWTFKDSQLMTEKRMDELVSIAISAGAENVIWSGMSRKGD